MATLNEGEFELDGFGFGGEGHGVVVPPSGFDPGSASLDTQDGSNPVGDGLLMGRDFVRPPLWGFTLLTNADTASDALDNLEALQAKWRADNVRQSPGAFSTLRYQLGGRTRRVYGRARRFSTAINTTLWSGLTGAVADFQLVDPLFYDDAQRSQTVSIVPASVGGVLSPLIGPITTLAGGPRQGVIADVGGSAPTPIYATIRGPITNPWVSGPGFKLQLNTSLGSGQYVTFDARPWAMTVRRNDGASLAGKLSRTSRLTDAKLRPGSCELLFGGSDPTATATCTVTWRPAFYSL